MANQTTSRRSGGHRFRKALATLGVTTILLSLAGTAIARADGLTPFNPDGASQQSNACNAWWWNWVFGDGANQSTSTGACSGSESVSALNQIINQDISQSVSGASQSVVVSNNNVVAASGGSAQSVSTASASAISGNVGSFQLCSGAANGQLAQQIAGFIGNHQFSASLTSGSAGCATLTITLGGVTPTGGNVEQSANLSVGTGSGYAPVSVRIESINGATSVYLGAAS